MAGQEVVRDVGPSPAIDRNGVFGYVSGAYGTEPEYLWARYPGYAVLRHPGGKWYGIVMDVAASKLGIGVDGIVDVLVIRCDPLLAGSLRMEPGFLPAYHMNKNSWISILLDGTVPAGEVEPLIDMSYAAAAPKAGKKRRKGG